MSDQDHFAVNMPVVQVGGDIGVVSRQAGLLPDPTPVNDPQPLRDVIQISDEMIVSRQTGNGHARFDASGTLLADHRAEDDTVYVDRQVTATGDANPPPASTPALAPNDQPIPPRPAFDVVPSDDGARDPRDRGAGPQVFSADKLPVIKKAPIVPVTVSASGTVRVAGAKKGRK